MTQDTSTTRFENLVSEYGHVIRSAVRRVAGTEAHRVAADVEQQVLLELWKQIAREQTIDYPSSYLYKAAVRETIRLARQARRRSEEDLDAVQPVRWTDDGPDTDPERRAMAGEWSRQLRAHTDDLSEDRRHAVIAHLAGYRVREIMAARGWTYQRARNLIARGMADLRRALTETES